MFEEAWAAQRDNYADPKYNGVDWNAVRKTYAPLIEGAHNPDEMRAILRLMIGELNSSHSGISAPRPAAADAASIGQLGLTFDRAAYENSGTLKITAVLPHSPAELAKIQAGRGTARRGWRGHGAARQSGRTTPAQDRQARRARHFRPAGHGAAGGVAGRADLSQVGGRQSRVCREDQQWPAGVCAHARHVGAGAGAALSRSRRTEPRARRRGDRHPQ